MAKTFGEKLRILYLRDYLLRFSDEDHPVSMKEILDYLEERNITADRRSIYRDLQVLGRKNKQDPKDGDDPEDEDIPMENYGMNIRKKYNRYYVQEREFTLQEVKILVDMVQSSNFITQKKTGELIDKITALASIYEAKNLKRTVYVRSRVKAMNESVYENVDRISEAVNKDEVLFFQYFTYNLKKEKELRHGGKMHEVSPFALVWVDQNYYMLGFSHEHGEIRPFRVDRMTRVSSAAGPRLGKREFEKVDITAFTTKVFHMYTGEIRLVTMRFEKYLADTVIDRFGEDIILIPDGDSAFTVSTEVAVSPQFYGWLAGFGKAAELIAPASVREGMAQHVRSMMKLYTEQQKDMTSGRKEPSGSTMI